MTEVHLVVKTTDCYLLCLSFVGFTKKHSYQIQKTSYVQHQQVCQIHMEMMVIMMMEMMVLVVLVVMVMTMMVIILE